MNHDTIAILDFGGQYTQLIAKAVRSLNVYSEIFSGESTLSQFEDTSEEVVEETRKKANVVAPATRSTAPKKVKLTQTQVAIAKRLGVPLELYAQKVAEEMRKT